MGRKAHLVQTAAMHIRATALAASLAGLVATAALVPAGAQPLRLRFGAPVTAIPASGVGRANTGEPRLITLPSGRLLLSAQFQQWDCATGKADPNTVQMCVWSSDDGGRTWQISGGDSQAGDDADFAVAPDGSVLQIGMADYQVGPQPLGTGLGGTVVMRSTNNGRTWSKTDFANKSVINDRPFVVSTPHAVLITFTGVTGNIQVVRSTDDGRTWSLPSAATPLARVNTIQVNGGPLYDAARHEVLAPYVYATDPTCASATAGCFDVVGLASSRDDGQTWTDERVLTVTDGGLTSMPQVTVDDDGHRYITYAAKTNGHDHVFVTEATTGGPWSTPRTVDGAQSSGIVPWALVTGADHLDVAYYRSAYGDAESTARPWDFVVSDSRDGGHHWTTSVVSPNAYIGTAADHQLVIWDLVGMTRTRAGRIVVTWTDALGKAGGPTVVRVARSLR
jgi:hypothetical protein